MIKGVAFDLYGTLLEVDVAKVMKIYNIFFARLGLTKAQTREAFQLLLVKNFESLGVLADHLNSNNELSKKEKVMLETSFISLLEQAFVFEDVYPALMKLQAFGFKTVVISNVSTPFIEPFQRLIGDNINASVFSCTFGQRKPSFDIFQEGCRKIDLKPDEVFMIGGSKVSDYIGAREAGMHSVLLERNIGVNTQDVLSINSLDEVFYYLN
ncbi:MAG: HAD family hydrolase [Patescibacteria group bacterium]